MVAEGSVGVVGEPPPRREALIALDTCFLPVAAAERAAV
jgi:hypothetical protein